MYVCVCVCVYLIYIQCIIYTCMHIQQGIYLHSIPSNHFLVGKITLSRQ